MSRRTRQSLAILLGVGGLIAVGLLITAQTPRKSQPLAQVEEKVITAEEVEKALGVTLSKLREQIYNLKRDKLEELVQQKLLEQEAAKRGLSVEALLEAEVNDKVEPVTEEEIQALYNVNKERLQGEQAELWERIRDYLYQRKLEARKQVFLGQLRADGEVVVHLKPPEVYRAEVRVEGFPLRGSEAAPVTIVKFEDFHCGFCRRVQSTLSQLTLRYGEKVKIVHRDFPLDSVHPGARKSHQAARCAGEQGEFWAYHDALYRNPPANSDEQFQAQAEELGLDLPRFEECLSKGSYEAAVEEDVQEGMQLGLTGTPSFFINGRLVSGAQPLENFVAIIEDELTRSTDARWPWH